MTGVVLLETPNDEGQFEVAMYEMFSELGGAIFRVKNLENEYRFLVTNDEDLDLDEIEF